VRELVDLNKSPRMNAASANPINIAIAIPARFLIICNVAIDIWLLYEYLFLFVYEGTNIVKFDFNC